MMEHAHVMQMLDSLAVRCSHKTAVPGDVAGKGLIENMKKKSKENKKIYNPDNAAYFY
jgi:hypothetical protein